MPKISPLAQAAQKLMVLRRRHYTEDFRLIMKDYRAEQGTAANYNGRQLLELLQNADDAADGLAKGGSVLVRLREGELTVANTGEVFTEEGLESILYSDLSPKYKKQNKIGAKGLGFRAVLGWAERIIIHSGGLRVAFSEEYAQKFLAELKQDSKELAVALGKRSPDPKDIATLCCAELLPPAKLPQDLAGYDTVLTMRLRPGVAALVQEQIEAELGAEVLVFLNHLQELRLDLPTGSRCLTRTRPKTTQVRVTVRNEDTGQLSSKDWQIVQEAGRHGEGKEAKNYELKVAWQADLSDQGRQLYSYFRTRVSFPFPVLAHGTFALSSDRNSLEDDLPGHNKFLLGRLAHLLAQAGLALGATSPEQVTYKPLRLLNWGRLEEPALEQRFKFRTRLLEALEQVAVFPTIANTYEAAAEAVAYDQDFAAYLDPAECSNVLLYWDGTEKAPVRALLSTLNQAGVYRGQYLLECVSKRRRALSAANYAMLLALTVESLDLDTEEGVARVQLPTLFYGGRGRADFAANTPVFLPVEGTRYELPEEVGRLQVLSVDLAIGLREALDCSNYAELGQSLQWLGVQSYSFGAVAEALLRGYEKEKPEVWHPFLYALYRQERVSNGKVERLQRAEGLRVYTAKGKVAPAATLYFGRAYGHVLGEELFAHDRGRLVAPAQRLGLDPKDPDVSDYLAWCGVEKYPRLVRRKVEDRAYVDEILRTLDYKAHKLDGGNIRTYEDLQREIQYHHGVTCEVEQVADFEELLLRAPLAAICSWLKQDERLAKRLEPGSREADKDSRLAFWLYRKKSPTELRGRALSSYLRWQCQRLAWLPVEGQDERVPPLYALHSTRNKPHNLQPILYAPAVPYATLAAKPYPGLSRAEVNRLLPLLGVALTVSEVPTTPLYELLLELPERVPNVRLAGVFYRELVDNYEGSPDRTSASYQEFLVKGRVACQRGQESPAFYPIQEAVYVDNSSYGTAVLACFPVMLASRKRGKDRVQTLFGVKPLDNITLYLPGPEPAPHPVQGSFATDFDDMRGYVLALRRTKNTTDSERLRKLRLQLALDVEAAFTLPATGEAMPVQMGPFEFVYLPDQNRAYLVVPAGLSNLALLKDSAEFCDGVAEVLCTALGVAEDRDKYAHLLASGPGKRRSLLRTWLGADAEPELSSSQQELDLATESQRTFWLALRAAAGLPALKEEVAAQLVTAEQWQTRLEQEFGAKHRTALTAVQQLDFTLPFTVEGLGQLRELLRAMSIDLAKLNTELGEAALDFRPYWLSVFTDLRAARRSDFKLALYERLQQQSEAAQRQFQQLLQKYQAGIDTVQNVVELDLNATFTEFVRTLLGVEMAPSAGATQVLAGIEERVTATRAELRQLAKEHGVPEQTVGKFLNELTHSSLLYFLSAGTLLKRLVAAYPRPAQPRGKGKSEAARAEVTVGGVRLEYDTWQDLAEQLDRLPALPPSIHTIQPVKQAVSKAGSGRETGRSRGRHGTQLAGESSETGFLGEYFAYRALCEQVGAEQVDWCSELAVEAGRGYDGAAGQGYDLRYRDKQGKVRYVEVKASTGEINIFRLTRKELQVGESSEEGRRHELLLVSFVDDPAQLRLERIAQPFQYKQGESFMDNARFGVEQDTFRVRFRRG